MLGTSSFSGSLSGPDQDLPAAAHLRDSVSEAEPEIRNLLVATIVLADMIKFRWRIADGAYMLAALGFRPRCPRILRRNHDGWP